jgi:hypothetical protein
MNLFDILDHGCPVLLIWDWQKLLFVLVPFFSAAFGAWIGQGSWLRIVTASFFGALRDSSLLLVIAAGLLVPTNPKYSVDCGVILTFGCAAGAALGATLAPYRGKVLLFLSGLGAFAGQYLLLVVLKQFRRRSQEYRFAKAEGV